jgi:hypothetical protein
MNYEQWQEQFDRRQRISAEYLAAMRTAKAMDLPAADKAEMIRILAWAAKRAHATAMNPLLRVRR